MSDARVPADADEREEGPIQPAPDADEFYPPPTDLESGGAGTVAPTTGPTPLSGQQIFSTVRDETDPQT